MNGIIIIDKPLHKTSFDVIRDLRKQYNIRKMGHIGTLDPMATGVLPILIGEATKLSDYLMEHDKEYIAKVYLGEKRSTGDIEGEVIEKATVPYLTKEEISKVLESFLGESMQMPPMYSAVKVGGKKLYELARQGKTVERAERKIKIDEIELLDCIANINDNKEFKETKIAEFSFRVVCSKGTYIRVLCENIAEKLGTVGYMSYLRRTRVGDFKIENANTFIEMKDILKVPKIDLEKIAKEDKIINDSNDINKSIKLGNKDLLKKLINGVNIKIDEDDTLVNLYNNGVFIGIGQVQNKNLKRKILLI